MIRFFFFLFGFGLSVLGMMYNILYLNLFTIGYSFFDYIIFIMHRYECIVGLIGFLIVTFTIFYKGDNANDFCLWYSA